MSRKSENCFVRASGVFPGNGQVVDLAMGHTSGSLIINNQNNVLGRAIIRQTPKRVSEI